MLTNCPLGKKETHACWECLYGVERTSDNREVFGYDCAHPDCDNQPTSVEIGFIDETNAAFAVGKINTGDLMSNTLQFDRCERIVFRDRTLNFVFELPEPYYKDIDTIIVNGIKFKKTE